MSTQYESLHPATLYPDAFHVAAPASPVGRKVWPRQPGVFIRAAQAAGAPESEEIEEVEEVAGADKPAREAPVRELVAGQFGLVPRWVKSASDAKLRSPKLVNARSETVTTSNNFRDAWLAGQVQQAGVELRQGWRVTDVVVDGGAVAGVRARLDGGGPGRPSAGDAAARRGGRQAVDFLPDEGA